MPAYYVKRGLEILWKEGPVELSKKFRYFISHKLIYRFILWLKYGEIRPKPGEILYVDPKDIDYGCGSAKYPDSAPPYGVLGGNWDLKKTHWTNRSFYGLFKRFEEGKPWEDTEYYQTCINKLESGKGLKRLDGPQKISNFKSYLDELDDLYEDIKLNGYDVNYPITVSIGRNGEWMINHGNHRHTMLKSIDTGLVPVRIKYRHKQWQELRYDIYNNGFSEEHDEELRNHPDIQDMFE